MHKEHISALIEKNKDDTEMIDFIRGRASNLLEYIAYVTSMEVCMQCLGEATVDEGPFNIVLRSIGQLNRLSARQGLPPFYGGTVDVSHKKEIEAFCNIICNEYFEGRS